jgi:hypothetical protein
MMNDSWLAAATTNQTIAMFHTVFVRWTIASR